MQNKVEWISLVDLFYAKSYKNTSIIKKLLAPELKSTSGLNIGLVELCHCTNSYCLFMINVDSPEWNFLRFERFSK